MCASNSLHNLGGQKWSCPCYHARHLQQIHCVGCMVSQPNRLFQRLTTMSLIDKIIFFLQWLKLKILLLCMNYPVTLCLQIKLEIKWSFRTYFNPLEMSINAFASSIFDSIGVKEDFLFGWMYVVLKLFVVKWFSVLYIHSTKMYL